MTSDADAPEQPAVLTERRGNVLLITLNRPQVRNAVNAALAEGVGKALDELDADGELSVGVLTGAGGFFCAGMDLGAFVKGESPWYGDRGFAGIAQRSADKPLIAAIEGFAVAGGMEIALACDLDRLGPGRETRHPGGQALAGRRRGRVAATAAADAYHVVMEAGSDRRSVPGRAFPRARPGEPPGRAGHGGRRGDGACGSAREERSARLRAAKKILQEQWDWSSEEMWAKQGEISGPVMVSEDAKEGASAFKEKREPVWRGVVDPSALALRVGGRMINDPASRR